MIPTIVAAISFVTIIVTTSVLVAKGTDMKKQYDDRLRVMTDQINNSQYYNSELDKKNISDISDVRNTYTSKDELSRSVDTRELSVRRAMASDLQAGSVTGEYMRFNKSSSDNLRTDKLLAQGGVVGQLEASMVNASRINMMGGEPGKGAISFVSTADKAGKGDYILQRGDKDYVNDVVMQVPKGSAFDIMDQDGVPGIRMMPTEGEMKISKWSVGKGKDSDLENNNVKYDMLGVNFDNKLIAGFYEIDGRPFTQLKQNLAINGDDEALMIMHAKDSDPIFMGTSASSKGIATWGDKPFEIWSTGGVKAGGVNIGWDETDINGVKFTSDSSKMANMINDTDKQKMLMLYGNDSLDGKSKNVGVSDNLRVFGNTESQEWTSGKNTQGKDHVVAGDWAAWMRNDGLVQGKTINSDQWSTGQNVMGRDHVVAGNWAAYMRNDGLVQGKTINSDQWNTGQNVMGRDHVVAGNWAAWMRNDGQVQAQNINSAQWSMGQNLMGRDHVTAGNWAAWMRNDGQTFAKNSTISDGLNVGQVRITGADGGITAKKITTGQINPQGGLTIGGGPLQLAADATFGAASAAGANKRFFINKAGNVGIGTDVPNATLHVNGDTLTNSIGRQGGSTDWFRINPQNANVGGNPGIAAYNGVAINDGGGLSVGSWTKAPVGVVQVTGKVIAPALTKRAGDNDWLRINADNAAAPLAVYGPAAFARGIAVGAFDPTVPTGNIQAAGNISASSMSRKAGTNDWFKIDNANGPGVAMVGSGAITKGLSVGAADANVPVGNVKATGQFCINSTCLSETDIKNIKGLIPAPPQNCPTSAAKYLAANADVKNAGINPWFHWTNYGQKEGRAWPPC
jgi:hypothetical protein